MKLFSNRNRRAERAEERNISKTNLKSASGSFFFFLIGLPLQQIWRFFIAHMKIVTQLNAECFRNAADYQWRTLGFNYTFPFHIKRRGTFDGKNKTKLKGRK